MSGRISGVRKGGFKDVYFGLPANRLKAVKALISEQCGWTPYTWGNKLYGRSSIRKLEAAVIEAVFAGYDMDPWTGEKLTTKIPA